MKKSVFAKGVAPLLLALSSLVIVPSAFAEPTPAPSVDFYKAALEQYKLDKEIYLTAMRDRTQQIKAINLEFKNSCDSAGQEFKSAMAIARTPDQKTHANATRKNAISAAIVARDVAITNLGPLPLPPVEPVKSAKPMKVSSKNRSR